MTDTLHKRIVEALMPRSGAFVMAGVQAQADRVLAAVQPVLDAKDTEIARLAARAERAEAERYAARADVSLRAATSEQQQMRADLAEAALSEMTGRYNAADAMARVGQQHLAKLHQRNTAIKRARELAEAALQEWEPEHEYQRDRAASKGYGHNEAAAETYGLAIEAVTSILAALDQPKETGSTEPGETVPAEAFKRLIEVAAYVSRGRRFVDVEPYPDGLARIALGAIDEATLRAALPEQQGGERG